MKSLASAVLVSAAVLLSACVDSTPPTGVPSSSRALSVLPGGGVRTIDDEYVSLVATAPGFGGLYRDNGGVFHIYLTTPASLPAVSHTLVAFIATFITPYDDAIPALVAERGRFDFAQLMTMYRQMRSVLPRHGVTQTDIDDRNNRIVVGIHDENARAAIDAVVATLHAPDGMIVVQVIPPTLSTSLQDPVYPIPAGVQIQNNLGTGDICTVGYNARLQSSTNGLFFPRPLYDHRVALHGAGPPGGRLIQRCGFRPAVQPLSRWTGDV